MSTFRGLGEVIAENGLFCSLYADRASHTGTRPAGGGVDKDNPRSAGPWRSSPIAAYSPRPGAARSDRDLAEAPAPGAAPRRDRHHGANPSRSSSGRRTTPASPARADTGSAFVAFAGTLETSSAPRRTASSRATTPCATRTARCRSRPIATATTTSRRRSGCTNIPTATWPSSTARCLARYRADGETIDDDAPGRVTRFDATEPGPVDKWTARQSSRPDHLSTGPTTTTEAVNSYIKRSTQFVIDSPGPPGRGGGARPCRSCAPAPRRRASRPDRCPSRAGGGRRRPPHPRSWRPGSPCRR